MDFNRIIILIAVILVIVDFFIPSDLPTFIAYALLAFLFSWNVDVPFLYKVIICLISWFVLVAFHFTIWKNVVQTIVNQFIAPTKHQDGPGRLIGATGKLRFIEDQWFVQIEGDIWPCEPVSEMVEGKPVRVIDFQNGTIKIKQ